MVARKQMPGVIHQYHPLDAPAWVDRFLDHWEPDLAIRVESELWPNILMRLKRRDIPCLLLNARISPKSQRNWSRFPSSFAALMGCFCLRVAQSEADKDVLHRLSGLPVYAAPNLKYAAAPLAVNRQDMTALQDAIGKRPTLIYASTHAPEEEIALHIHRELKHDFPNLLSVLIPRHPERATDLLRGLNQWNNNIDLRMAAEHVFLPTPDTEIYMVNSFGEMGLFYALGHPVFMGNSGEGTMGGGHNPLEPAHFGCAIMTGPHIWNFRDMFCDLEAVNGAVIAKDKDSLIQTARALLSDSARRDDMGQAAQSYARTMRIDALERNYKLLEPFLAPLLQSENQQPGKDPAQAM